MSVAAERGFRLRGGGRRRHGGRASERLLAAVLLLGAVAVLIAIVWNVGSERRALRALPDEQRLALLARTVDELRQSCGEGRPDALKKHCHELASFAALFDECRGECVALVRLELAPPLPR